LIFLENSFISFIFFITILHLFTGKYEEQNINFIKPSTQKPSKNFFLKGLIPLLVPVILANFGFSPCKKNLDSVPVIKIVLGFNCKGNTMMRYFKSSVWSSIKIHIGTV